MFKTSGARLLTALAAVGSAIVLWQLYKVAPIAIEVVHLRSRLAGLVLAAVVFLASNLFFQAPWSALRILFVSDAKLRVTQLYPVERIKRDFTVVGLQVKQILPSLEPTP